MTDPAIRGLGISADFVLDRAGPGAKPVLAVSGVTAIGVPPGGVPVADAEFEIAAPGTVAAAALSMSVCVSE